MKFFLILFSSLSIFSTYTHGQNPYALKETDLKKPYEQIFFAFSVKSTTLKGDIITPKKPGVFEFGLTKTKERTPRKVMVFRDKGMVRFYFLERLVKRDELSTNANQSGIIIEIWRAIYEKPDSLIPVIIALHRKDNWIFQIQIREPSNRIDFYSN